MIISNGYSANVEKKDQTITHRLQIKSRHHINEVRKHFSKHPHNQAIFSNFPHKNHAFFQIVHIIFHFLHNERSSVVYLCLR